MLNTAAAIKCKMKEVIDYGVREKKIQNKQYTKAWCESYTKRTARVQITKLPREIERDAEGNEERAYTHVLLPRQSHDDVYVQSTETHM